MANKSRRAFIKQATIGTGALTLLANGGWQIVYGAAGDFTVRILHTNDHHARIEPVLNGTTPQHGGVSRRKTMIDARRTAASAASQDLLLLDAGDVFQGTLYFNLYKGLADLEFYRAMQYDAMTIGNHEFDNGDNDLATFIKQATGAQAFTPPIGGTALSPNKSFPVLSANITAAAPSPLNGLIKANTIITLPKSGKKIGIFGLTTPETSFLASPSANVTFAGLKKDPTTGLDITDSAALAEIVDQQVAALKSAGATAIIALTHIGYNYDLEVAALSNASSEFMIIGGHSHTPLGPQPSPAGPYPTEVTNKAGKKIKVFTDWEWGRWLGDFTVTFSAAGEVASITGNPVEVVANSTATGYVEPDSAFTTRIGNDSSGYAQPVRAEEKKIIGSTNVRLNGDRASVRTQETNLGNLIADAMLTINDRIDQAQTGKVQIVITNGGGIRASIDAGNISRANVLTVLPFGNTISLVTLTAAQLFEALENGVSQVETAQGRFPQVAGMRFTFSQSYSPGNRVLKVEVRNDDGSYTEVKRTDSKSFRVATVNFMLAGGDGYTVLTKGSAKSDTGFTLDEVVQDYITKNTPITADKIVMGRITARFFNWMPVVEQAKA